MKDILESILSVPSSDWLIAIFGFLSVGIFLLITEYGRRNFNLPVNLTRKIVHIVTGLIVCVAAVLSDSSLPIQIFAFLYIFIDIWSLQTGKFKSIHPDRNSLGTVFYAISVLILASVFWGDRKALFVITNLIMIIPDAMAAILGERYAKSYFRPLREKKSLLGALTMACLTFIIVFISLKVYLYCSFLDCLIIALIISVIAATAELVSIRGSDNLSVPLLSGLFLYYLLDPSFQHSIIIGSISAIVFAYSSYKMKFLDIGGALLVLLMGSILFGLGGWQFTLPILLFFVSSSILSKVGKGRKRIVENMYQKSSQRDFFQVLANGGVPTLIFLFILMGGSDHFYLLYLISIAAATSDTWATELGIFSKRDPFLITVFKSVPPGTSGAISIPGSFASLLASTLIALSGLIFTPFSSTSISIIILCGFSGSIVDSLLGATVQAQFECSLCKKLTESRNHCDAQAKLIKGIKWMDNDLVNIFSILMATIAGFLLIFVRS